MVLYSSGVRKPNWAFLITSSWPGLLLAYSRSANVVWYWVVPASGCSVLITFSASAIACWRGQAEPFQGTYERCLPLVLAMWPLVTSRLLPNRPPPPAMSRPSVSSVPCRPVAPAAKMLALVMLPSVPKKCRTAPVT